MELWLVARTYYGRGQSPDATGMALEGIFVPMQGW
jgi:hypothetical protein